MNSAARWPWLFALLLASCAAAPTRPQRSPYDLVLPAVEGGRYDLTQLQGRPALVYFFSTWCLPCLMEVKTLAAMQHQFQAQRLAVVAIGLDLEGLRVLTPFHDSLLPPFPVLVADDEVRSGASPYGPIRAIPTSVLLDRTGRVAAAYEGPADPAVLERALKELVER